MRAWAFKNPKPGLSPVVGSDSKNILQGPTHEDLVSKKSRICANMQKTEYSYNAVSTRSSTTPMPSTCLSSSKSFPCYCQTYASPQSSAFPVAHRDLREQANSRSQCPAQGRDPPRACRNCSRVTRHMEETTVRASVV